MNNDLISREALKKAVINNFDNLQDYFPKDFIEEIDNAPTVELTELCKGCQYLKDCETCDKSERPQGQWIRKVDMVGFISHICSECGAEIEVEDPKDDKFCFSCGADMRKGGAK